MLAATLSARLVVLIAGVPLLLLLFLAMEWAASVSSWLPRWTTTASRWGRTLSTRRLIVVAIWTEKVN